MVFIHNNVNMIKNRKIRIVILISSIVFMVVLGFLIILDYAMPLGGNRFVESYKFNCTKEELKNSIEKFRKENPEFSLPEDEYLPNGIMVQLPYFEDIQYPFGYSGYLYDSEKNQIIHFYITKEIPVMRGDTPPCILDFVGINEGLTLGKWKLINKDFNSSDNKRMKKEFEETILNKLGISYEKEGNNKPIFYGIFNNPN